MVQSKKPFFSIIIPALNEEKYLPKLLKDYSKQTMQDFEVIIIDGKSSDKTVEKSLAMKNSLPSLTVLSSKIRNVSVQRNMGAEEAQGEYLLFNDADNSIPPYYLEGIKYNISAKPADTFTVWCNADSRASSDRAIATYLNLMIEAANQMKNPAALGAMIGCRRSIFGKTGGFNPEVGFAEDTEFVRQAHKKGYSFTVYHDPRYVYSLRRFRSKGKLKLIQKYAILNLKYLTKQRVDQEKEYPMGGEAFIEDNKTQTVIQKIGSFNRLLKKPKILDRITALLNLEEK